MIATPLGLPDSPHLFQSHSDESKSLARPWWFERANSTAPRAIMKNLNRFSKNSGKKVKPDDFSAFQTTPRQSWQVRDPKCPIPRRQRTFYRKAGKEKERIAIAVIDFETDPFHNGVEPRAFTCGFSDGKVIKKQFPISSVIDDGLLQPNKTVDKNAPNMKLLPLIPGIKNPEHWYPDRPSASEWKKIRKAVLDRDKGLCRYCGHKGTNYMNVHHLRAGDNNRLSNLVTCCGPCHAVQHIGRNLSFELIEIWRSKVSQIIIIRETRNGIKRGLSLSVIKKVLKKKYDLKRGIHPAGSTKYANMLIPRKKSKLHAFYIPEPYKVIFTKLKRWNIEKKGT